MSIAKKAFALVIILFAIFFGRYGFSARAIECFVFCSACIYPVITDYETKLIPDAWGTFFFPVVALYMHSLPSLYAGLIVSGILMWIAIIADFVLKKETLGFGDVMFMAGAGAFLGIKPGLISIVLACFCGTGMYLLGLLKRDEPFAFIPLLFAGVVLILAFPEMSNLVKDLS